METRVRDVTIRQLRALEAVAKNGSITAAAHKLNLTQPAITQQLRNLGDLVGGAPLLQRTSDGMLLTQAGEELLELGRRIEASISACEISLAMINGASGGRISIGAVSTAKYFVPYVIAEFSKLHPKIDIRLTIGNREEIRRALRGYEMDFAIMGRPPQDIDVEVRLIGDHPHIIIAPSGHPRANEVKFSLNDLADETFISREPGSGTRTLMESMFEANDIQPKIGMEMSSNETIKQAVIAGLGVAFISAHTVATELNDGRLTSLDVVGLPIVRQWFVVHRRDKVMLPPATVMLTFLGTEASRFLP